MLISYGDRYYDEENNYTVAQYILDNLQDLESPFDTAAYDQIITICRTRLTNGESINSDVFVNHPDQEISKIVVDLLATPHHYANWAERGVMLQTQKAPDENYERDAFQSVMRFKLKKVKRGIKELETMIKEPSKRPEDLDEATLIKVLQLKMNERNEIARQLSTIIL